MNEGCIHTMMTEERTRGPMYYAGLELKASRRRKNQFQALEMSFGPVRSTGTERLSDRTVK